MDEAVACGDAMGNDVEVVDVAGCFEGVHCCLCAGEPVLGVIGGPAVDVVYAAVELVGGPYRVVEFAAGHSVGAKKDVESVPDYEGNGDEEPWD